MKNVRFKHMEALRLHQVHHISGSVQDQMWRMRKRAIWGGCTPFYAVPALGIWSASPPPSNFAELVSQGGVVIAEENGMLRGYAMMDIRCGEVVSLFVEPLHQGKGVGRALILSIKDIAARHGMQHLFVYATLNARRFYQHAGFTFVREQDYELASGLTLKTAFMAKAIHENMPETCRG